MEISINHSGSVRAAVHHAASKPDLHTLNDLCGRFADALHKGDPEEALKTGEESLTLAKTLRQTPHHSADGGLAGILAAITALIQAINDGSLKVWAQLASSSAADNAAYSKAESDQLTKDSDRLNGLTPGQVPYQQAVNKYSTDQTVFQGYIMVTQNNASNAADEVSDLTKTFQADYQNISTILQLSSNLARIMAGG